MVVAQTQDLDASPATLERLDPATGARRWAVSVPRTEGAVGMSSPLVRTLGGDLVLGWLGSTTVYTGEGGVAGSYTSDYLLDLRGRRWTVDPDDTDTLRDVVTGRSVGIHQAYPPWIATDDGSAPGILLLQDADGLHGVDVGTGDDAWTSSQGSDVGPAATVVVDGTVAVLGGGALRVRDLVTGDVLWELPATTLRGDSLLTDGSRLVVLTDGPGANAAAYDLRTGRPVWSTQVPAGIQTLAVVDHRLFGIGDSLVAFDGGSAP